MLKRTMDAGFLNEVANDPDVRPYIGGGMHEIDFSDVLELPGVEVWRSEHGAIFCQRHHSGIVEVHVMFLPVAYGREAVRAARWMRDYLFENGCKLIVAFIPPVNIRAQAIARLIRMHRMDAIGLVASVDTENPESICFCISFDEWKNKCLQ